MVIQGARPAPENAPLSELLDAIAVTGQTWCYCDFGADGGFSLPPGDALIFHFVLHGTLRITTAGSGTAEFKAGDAVAILSGEAHALRCGSGGEAVTLDFLRDERPVDVPPTIALGSAGPVRARTLSGRLAISLPSRASRSALPPVLHLGSENTDPLVSLLRPGALAQAGIGAGSAALLTRIAGLMLVAQLRGDPAVRRIFAPEPVDPISQSLELIAGNPSADWTVERLARAVGMGRSNFAAHFTERVGRAPMEVVAEKRMDQAAELLRKGNLKIAEISELSGYGSEAAFSRRFSRHFGMTPSRMRACSRSDAPLPAVDPGWQPLLASRRPPDSASLVRHRAVAAERILAMGPRFLRGA